MYVFNSLQIVSIFAALPFLIQWLMGSQFAYATALGWIVGVAYVALFFWLTVLVYMGLCEGPK